MVAQKKKNRYFRPTFFKQINISFIFYRHLMPDLRPQTRKKGTIGPIKNPANKGFCSKKVKNLKTK